jgi:hypothetical protein
MTNPEQTQRYFEATLRVTNCTNCPLVHNARCLGIADVKVAAVVWSDNKDQIGDSCPAWIAAREDARKVHQIGIPANDKQQG